MDGEKERKERQPRSQRTGGVGRPAHNGTREMAEFSGTWKMKSSENFDELLKALGVNAMLRKVAGAAASKPHVEIKQSGDHFYIKTSTTVRTTEINFTIGEEFSEETVDGRKCKSLATWETEHKIYCKQTLLSGNGPKTFWSRELKGDELILIFGADDVICTRIYVRAQ
ncbi:cellular retinoic acid-binding protein 1-like [Fundulus diaphanus]